MDDIVRDPEIGPDLVAFLSQKVKAARDSLRNALEENEALREEIKKLKEERSEASMKVEALPEGGLPNITCRIGQCASRDDAERLKADVERLTMRLQATEADLHATTANLEATEKAWEESADSLKETEQQYTELAALSEKQKRDIRDLRQQLRHQKQEDRDETDSSALSECDSDQESVEEVEGSDDEVDVQDQGQAGTSSSGQASVPIPLTRKPCLLSNGSLAALNALNYLMCPGGFIYKPGRSSVNTTSGSATIYGTGVVFPLKGNGGKTIRTPASAMDHLVCERREIFYKSSGENCICYAGTFEASPVIGNYDAAQYRVLSKPDRKRILSFVMPGKKGRTTVHQRIWNGEVDIKLQYLEWERVDFNMELFNALRSQLPEPSDDTEGQQTVGSKRKASQQDIGAVAKRTRSHKK